MYLAGETTSPNFPATGLQKTSRGVPDGFLTKLSADGSRVVYSTFLGGTYEDRATAVAVDDGGSAYVTGSTYSADFPVANARQGVSGGGQDAFVARISADGASLLFSTYLGGSGGSLGYPEAGQALALDSQGNAYVAGVTSSADFPLLHPFQSSRRGATDAFVSKLNASGTLLYSTYLGGTGVDSANAIAVDADGNAYVAGQTFSKDLPVANATQAANGGDYDAFTAKLGPGGDTLPFLSYLGGAGSDTATAIALDAVRQRLCRGMDAVAEFSGGGGLSDRQCGIVWRLCRQDRRRGAALGGRDQSEFRVRRVPDLHDAVLRSVRSGGPDHRLGFVQHRHRDCERLLGDLYPGSQHHGADDRCGHRAGQFDHARQRDAAEQPVYVERRVLERHVLPGTS